MPRQARPNRSTSEARKSLRSESPDGPCSARRKEPSASVGGSFCFAGALRDDVVYSAQQIKLWRMTMQKIRTATFEDLDAIAAV